MAATPPPLDYQQLARLLESAASDQQRLALTADDPVARYQSSVNAQLFTAARRCAKDHARTRQPPQPLRTARP